jgi:ABC-type sugar transport system ATPase subunit
MSGQQTRAKLADGESQREIAFEAVNVRKAYPGVVAVNDVSLQGYAGEVLAICGANGAGKSTFARLLAGQELPTDGEIRIPGWPRAVDSPSSAAEAGILLMHQEPLIIDDFSIAENVWLKDLSAVAGVHPWGLISSKKDKLTRNALSEVGLGAVSPSRLASTLGPGQRQMLALSRTKVNPHRILLLDETTASTTEEHFKDVQQLVQAETASGVAVVFVSHRMPEVFAMSDRIAVLRNGRLVDVVRTADTTEDEVMTLMIGDAVKALEPPHSTSTVQETPALKVDSLSSGSAKNISFSVQPGEIVGIYGLIGSGRSSVARSIGGQQDFEYGRIEAHGKSVTSKSPRSALRHGIVYLTEDRRKEGFVTDFTNAQNLTLVTLDKSARAGIVDLRAERTRVRELIAKYQVKGGGDVLTSTLSGGNQQKVCIAKWLEADPGIIVLDEPTKGIDVGARMNIYSIIHDLAKQKKAVVVVTSEAEEALMLCHRVLIMRDGHITAEFRPAESTTDDLIRAALGGDIA